MGLEDDAAVGLPAEIPHTTPCWLYICIYIYNMCIYIYIYVYIYIYIEREREIVRYCEHMYLPSEPVKAAPGAFQSGVEHGKGARVED